MTHYLIVGNGVAGTTAAETIRKEDKNGPITILTDEDIPFYYRIRLSEYLSGDLSEQDLVGKGASWYLDQGIDLKGSSRINVKIHLPLYVSGEDRGDNIMISIWKPFSIDEEGPARACCLHVNPR